MIDKLKVYLHGESIAEAKIIEIESGASHEEIIKYFHKETNASGSVEDYKLFIEREDADGITIEEEEVIVIKHKTHIHCHRCEKVEATIGYQHLTENFPVGPETTVAQLTKLAAKAFRVSPVDAADLVLRLGTDILPVTEHIGTLVKYPDCKITLALTPPKQFQG